MKVCFETFGCRLNRAEALEEEAKYLARGWELTDAHAEAQLIVVRGCSVTARAQRDCERLIAHLREKYPLKRIIVTGCLKDAKRDYVVREVAARSHNGEATSPSLRNKDVANSIRSDGDVASPVPMRTARAYLKVQDGCNGKCAFCIVPQFRGKATSVPADDVLARADAFLAAGYHELVLTGCNLAQYNDVGRRLADLVAALSDRCGTAARLRLGSVEPGPAALDLVAVMAERANVCRYLHVSVQSGSDRILSAMRRPYLRHDIETLVREAVRRMPDLGLGCDVLTGFPDETDTDFLATHALLERLPFTKAHVFPFSERPGTVAATLPNAVPRAVRHERARVLADLMETVRVNFIRRFKGKTVRIVIEDEATLAGWTSEYVWCQVGAEKAKALTRDLPGRRGLHRRALVDILVRDVEGHVLTGDPVREIIE